MRRPSMVLVLGLAACGGGIEAERDRYEAAVDTYCERTVTTCADEQLEFYTDLADCHSVWDTSFYESDADCAAASADYLECIAGLECGEYADWDSGTSALCDAEESAWSACYSG